MQKFHNNDPFDVLAQAYETMFEHARDGFLRAENKTAGLFHELVDEAVETAVEIDQVSREDALALARYIKRDVGEAAAYVKSTGRDLADWLGFKTTLLEMEFVDSLLQSADPTTVAWLQMKQPAQPESYHSGEVSGPGTLRCLACGQSLHFQRASRIPPCPACHGTAFERAVATEEA